MITPIAALMFVAGALFWDAFGERIHAWLDARIDEMRRHERS